MLAPKSPPQSPAANADQVGRISQIIVGALITGQVMFGAVAATLRLGKPGEIGLISYLGAGFASLMVVLSLFLRQQMASRLIGQLAEPGPTDWRAALAGVYQTRTIVTNAVLEGAGIFNGVACIVEGHWLSLAIMGVMVALMALTFPSQSQFEAWAEQVQRDHS